MPGVPVCACAHGPGCASPFSAAPPNPPAHSQCPTRFQVRPAPALTAITFQTLPEKCSSPPAPQPAASWAVPLDEPLCPSRLDAASAPRIRKDLPRRSCSVLRMYPEGQYLSAIPQSRRGCECLRAPQLSWVSGSGSGSRDSNPPSSPISSLAKPRPAIFSDFVTTSRSFLPMCESARGMSHSFRSSLENE